MLNVTYFVCLCYNSKDQPLFLIINFINQIKKIMKNISIKFLLVVFKTYLSNLPKSIKVLLLINIVIYFIFFIISWLFSYNLNYTFGAYPTCSEKFKVYQIFTFMFSHDISPDHIICNLIIFLLFSPAVSIVIGNNNTIKVYVFSGLISFFLFNYINNNTHNKIADKLTKTGFDVKKIKLLGDCGYIDISTYGNINEKQKKLIHMYHSTMSYLSGASVSIFAFIIIYPFLFIKRKKTILLNLLVLLLVIDLIYMVIDNYIESLGTMAAHMGGVIGGIVFFIFWLLYLKNKTVGYLFTENKKAIQNEAAPILQINAS